MEISTKRDKIIVNNVENSKSDDIFYFICSILTKVKLLGAVEIKINNESYVLCERKNY